MTQNIPVMLRYYVKIFFLLSVSLSTFGQEAILNSPFWVNKSYINPSYVGDYEKPLYDALFTTKQLWVGIDGAPRVNGMALNNKFNRKNAVGLQLWQHTYGALNYSSVSIPYSFNAQIDRNQGFSLGLTPTYTTTTLDLSQITRPERFDLETPIPDVRFLDASFGAHYYYDDIFRFGLFASNLMINGNINSDEVINYTNYSMSSYGADISFYLNENRYRPLSLLIDGYIKFNPYTAPIAEISIRSGEKGSFIGLGYRSNQDVNIILQMGDNDRFNFGYIYTYSISALQQYSNGSNQVYLKFRLPN
jgi:type IX secretion system PorP/SprF family membrane protein